MCSTVLTATSLRGNSRQGKERKIDQRNGITVADWIPKNAAGNQ